MRVNVCLLCCVSGQDAPNKQAQRAPNPSSQLTCTVTNGNLFSICSLFSPTGSNSDPHQRDPDVLSHLSHTSVSDDGLLVSKVSSASSESSPGPRSADEGSLSDRGMTEGWEDEVKGGRNTEGRDMSEERREELQGEEVKEGRSAGGMRGTLVAPTTDTASGPENNQRSAGDAEDTRQPETETKDRAEAAGTDGEEERAKTEVLIPVQTAADTESDTQQVIDIRRAEPPLVAWALSDCSQKAGEMVEDSGDAANGCETSRAHTFCSDEPQSAGCRPSSGDQETQRLSCDEAIVPTRDEAFEKAAEETPAVASELCSSRTAVLPAESAHVNIQKSESKQTQRANPSDMTGDKKQTDEECEPHVWMPDDVCVGIMNEATDLESGEKKDEKEANAADAKTSQSGAVTTFSTYSSHKNDASPQTFSEKCYKRSPAKEMLLDGANVLPSNMSYRSAFDWSSTQRKALSSRTKSDVSVLHQFVQVSHFNNARTTIQWPSEDL